MSLSNAFVWYHSHKLLSLVLADECYKGHSSSLYVVARVATGPREGSRGRRG